MAPLSVLELSLIFFLRFVFYVFSFWNTQRCEVLFYYAQCYKAKAVDLMGLGKTIMHGLRKDSGKG